MSARSSADFSVGSGRSAYHVEFTKFSQAECCKYITFLVIFTSMVIFGRSLDEFNFYVSEEVQDALCNQYFVPAAPLGMTEGEISFNDIDQYFEIYDFMTDVALPVLLMERDAENDVITDSAAKHLVAGQNKVIGAIRFRQLRVTEENCRRTSDAWTCYPEWSHTKEDTDGIPSGITWRSTSELEEQVPWWGIRTRYPGSGYVVDLPLNRTAAIIEMARLKSTGFLDQATRFVTTDFVLYNPSLNLHAIGRFAFELAPSGAVLPSYEVKTWRFYRYEETRGTLLIVFESLFIVFVIYFTAEEIYEFKTKGWDRYKQDKWNIADVINLVFFYITIIWRIVEIEQIKGYELLPQDNTYSNLRDLARAFELEAYMQMVNGFMLYLKLFKYMTFSKRVKFLFAMLRKSSDDLSIFSIVLLVLFLAFGMVGFLAFSSDVNDFRSFPHSVINLLRYTVTEPPYEELSRSNKAFGSFFFVVWGLVMLLILANVFIAILSDSYAVIINEIEEEDHDFFNLLFRGSIVEKLIKKVKSFKKTDKNADGKVDMSELKDAMSMSESKAQEVMRQFDADGDGALDEREYKNLLEVKSKAKVNQIAPASTSEKKGKHATSKRSKSRDVMSDSQCKPDTVERLDQIERMLSHFAETTTGSQPPIEEGIETAEQKEEIQQFELEQEQKEETA